MRQQPTPAYSATSNGGSKSYSISRLNQLIKGTIESNSLLQNIQVEGEIFNLTHHASGHIYFSLKDETSSVKCTFFKNANQKYKDIRLQAGMKILAFGSVSVYAPRGEYQFNVNRLVPSGEGELRLRIEQLKKKLHQEGLFDSSLKKELPSLPITLGVATAPTGAAIQDIIRVSRSRFPSLNILLAPCLVQGDGAVASIVAAIEALNDPALEVDLIIAGRGGGSFEDLMAFNEEPVVRAFARSAIPIISAVGHEIDHPVSDLAADAFAATPSAAVEMSIPVLEDIEERINELTLRLHVGLKSKYRRERERLQSLMRSRVYLDPVAILDPFHQRFDLASRDLRLRMIELLKERRSQLKDFAILPVLYKNFLTQTQSRFELLSERLQNFSPLSTLKRGYSIVRDQNKHVIRSSREVEKGDVLELLLARGRLMVEVNEVLEE